MLSSKFYSSILALSALLSHVNGQFFTKCIRTCIDNSQYSNCKVSDLPCLCRAGRSSGSFLPDVVTCVHNSCIDIGVDLLLSPFEAGCNLVGAPLPDTAIDAAKSAASSLATETQTQTTTTTATTEFTRVVQTTITQTEEGSTQIVVFPITIERTTTVSGEPSTVTRDATASGSSALSSASSALSSGGSALSSTLSSVISSLRSSSSTSMSQESTTTILTSTTVLGEAVTSTIENTQSGAATSSPGAPASETNSAPFTNTNAAGKVVAGGSWLGLGIFVVMGVMLF